MKKLIVGLAIAVVAIVGLQGSASAVSKSCGDPVYQYPTGSYWQQQISAYPQYYQKHNAQFMQKYGC